ncbi:MAG: hypothetical protein NDJ24_05655 [Alphaproteobacteria bacterium]|nr:hypothetical protein [Alphaproteobacteria bacterium]
MTKLIRNKSLQMSAAFVAGYVMTTTPAHANNFNSIAQNIVESIASLPSLLSALSYMFGILLGTLGIMKIKDHVENPGQTPLKDGAVRLLAGGALLALPIIFEAMFLTAGSDGNGASVASLESIDWL